MISLTLQANWLKLLSSFSRRALLLVAPKSSINELPRLLLYKDRMCKVLVDRLTAAD